jgi:hypothetical protein
MGLPVYEELSEAVVAGILDTDFAFFCGEDFRQGLLALITASLQAVNLRQGALVRRLREQLNAVAEISTAHSATIDSLSIPGLLLEIGLNLAVSDVTSRHDAVVEFGAIVDRLVATRTELAAEYLPLIQRLYEELPIEDSQTLAALLFKMRATT